MSFYDENKFLAARIPDKVTVAVIKTHRIGAGIDGEVTVENGRKIKVPHHVKEGDTITIKLSNEEYVTKN